MQLGLLQDWKMSTGFLTLSAPVGDAAASCLSSSSATYECSWIHAGGFLVYGLGM